MVRPCVFGTFVTAVSLYLLTEVRSVTTLTKNCPNGTVPLHPICQTLSTYNMIFLIDMSGSVGLQGYQKLQRFVAEFINGQESYVRTGIAHFAAATYSLYLYRLFDLGSGMSAALMAQAVRDQRFESGSTNTALALRYVQRRFLKAKYGFRRDFRTLLVLLTDGGVDDRNGTIEWATKLKDAGVEIYLVKANAGSNLNEITEIVSDPTMVLNADGTGQAALRHALRSEYPGCQVCECKKWMEHHDGKSPFPYPLVYINNDIGYLLCDTQSDEGGWIVVHRRVVGGLSYYTNWSRYKKGFGSIYSDIWLGLDKISNLSRGVSFELRIELGDKIGETPRKVWARYASAVLANESSEYALTINGYAGTAGNGLSYQNDMSFSTLDRDNDICSCNCAILYKSGWWFSNCGVSNLFGIRMKWNGNYKYETAEMKIRLS